MGLKTEVDALYLSTIETQNVRYAMLPAGVPIACVSDGAAAANVLCANYITIVAAATITNPSWLTGVALYTPVVEAFQSDVDIATGAAGVKVPI